MSGNRRTRPSTPPEGDPDRRLLQVAVGLGGIAFGLLAAWVFGQAGVPGWKLVQGAVVGWAWFLANLQWPGIALLFAVGLWLAQLQAAVRLRRENQRLQVDVQEKADALRVSQARIVEATDEARRRVERDLHDGAQQRLLALSLTLSLARSQLAETRSSGLGQAGGGAGAEGFDGPWELGGRRGPGELGGLGTTLTRASEQAALVLEELRELARGIHPAVLSQGGLAAAVELVAERAPLPVQTSIPRSRYRPVVEATAYFVVCEALANAVKHAHASKVRVRAEEMDERGRWLVVEVADDGIGGADPGRGSGIVGLAGRVDAVGGRMVIESPTGRGTRVEVKLPCD